MKKFLLLLIPLLPLSSTLCAQFSKGDVVAGAEFSLLALRNTRDHTDLFALEVKDQHYVISVFGEKFLSDRFALGLSAGYDYYDYLGKTAPGTGMEIINDQVERTNGFAVSLYGAYYLPLTRRIFVKFTGGIPYSYSKTHLRETDFSNAPPADVESERISDEKSNRIGVDLSASLTFALTKRWMVNMWLCGVSYDHYWNDYSEVGNEGGEAFATSSETKGSVTDFSLFTDSFRFGVGFRF